MPEYSLAELETLAAGCWRGLEPGSVVWLSGDLGSGKTTFVRSLARAAGAGGARSPSFALIHEYPSAAGPLIHVDCYRLRRPEEALDLDLPALAARSRLLLIEWPERAGRFAPPPHLHVRLSHTGEATHRLVEGVA